MVCCEECRYFIKKNIEGVFAGICNAQYSFGEYFDFLETWQVEEGHCDLYAPLDANNSKRERDQA